MNNHQKKLGLFIALSMLFIGIAFTPLAKKNEPVIVEASTPVGYTRVWIQVKGGWVAANGASIRYKAWRSSDNTYLNTSDSIGFSPIPWSLGGTITSGLYTIPKVYYYDIDTNASMNYDTFRFLRISSNGTNILNESADYPLSSWTNRNYRFMSGVTNDMAVGTNSWTIPNFKTLTGITSLKTCYDYEKIPDLLMAYEALDYNTQTLRDAALLASTYSTEYDYITGNDLTPNNPYGTNYTYTTNTITVNLLNKIKYMVKVYDSVHSTSLYASYWGTTTTNQVENIANSLIDPTTDIMMVLVLSALAVFVFFFIRDKSLIK